MKKLFIILILSFAVSVNAAGPISFGGSGSGDMAKATYDTNSDSMVDADKINGGIDATKIGAGGVTSTEFGYIGTVTSDVQTQLGTKAPTANATMTGTFTMPSMAFTPLTAAPGSPVAGTWYYADNDTWDPISYAGTANYWVIYDGASYIGIIDEDGVWLISSLTLGGLILGDSSPDAAGEIGYDGALKYYNTASRTVVSLDETQALSGKTLDVADNVIKTWGYIVLTHPHLGAAGAPIQTTSTANTYGQGKFGNATDKATNYVEYYLVVPSDIDTSVDLTATFKFKLGGADTGDHEYEISFDSVADSAAYAGSLGDPISLAYTADASGADGDVETAGETTLTGWRSAMTAGQLFVIRLARDGDHANDSSTVDSYSGPLIIKYKTTQ